MFTVHLTKMQAGEIAHKMCIVRDEPDLLEAYEADPQEVDSLAEQFLRIKRAGYVAIDPRHVELIIGELENACDIASNNIDDGCMEWVSYRNSLKQAIGRIADARDRAPA